MVVVIAGKKVNLALVRSNFGCLIHILLSFNKRER